jgi:Arc/MetJ-type ribon-helix-helix transcriptional regulator
MVVAGGRMKPVSVHIPEIVLKGIDRLVEARVYPSRSEAIRAAVRDMVLRELGEDFFRIVDEGGGWGA